MWKQGSSLDGLFPSSLQDSLPAPHTASKGPSKSVVRPQRKENSAHEASLWTRDGCISFAYNQFTEPPHRWQKHRSHPQGPSPSQAWLLHHLPPPQCCCCWAEGVVSLLDVAPNTVTQAGLGRQTEMLQCCESPLHRDRPLHTHSQRAIESFQSCCRARILGCVWMLSTFLQPSGFSSFFFQT